MPVSWKDLGQKSREIFSGLCLVALILLLLLTVESRTVEYRKEQQNRMLQEQEIPVGGPSWTTVLEPTPSPAD